jgi:hypothetical protein
MNGAQETDGPDRPRRNHRPRHRFEILHQKHTRHRLWRKLQHSGRRGLHRPGSRFGGRPCLHNAPTIYQGIPFDGIRLEFSKGKIVKAEAGAKSKQLNKILDTDEGARYIGEFALGFHPVIREPMRDILFDEKIAGSFHFTPGQAYEEADNGNRSQVHWDMVNIQRKDWGGGEIRFDGKLIRKDGVFLPKPLAKLNG